MASLIVARQLHSALAIRRGHALRQIAPRARCLLAGNNPMFRLAAFFAFLASIRS
jgi:hypothetical protein